MQKYLRQAQTVIRVDGKEKHQNFNFQYQEPLQDLIVFETN